MQPRDISQDGWVGFVNQVQWWDGSKWNNWFNTDPTYLWEPADYFVKGLLSSEPDWVNGRTGQVWDGSWEYTVPKGYWYAVRTILVWFPQPSYPNFAFAETHAHQDAFATNPGWELCKR